MIHVKKYSCSFTPMKHTKFILLSFLIPLSLYAQTHKIDSLQLLLGGNEIQDTIRGQLAKDSWQLANCNE